jgi:hypothetical protein
MLKETISIHDKTCLATTLFSARLNLATWILLSQSKTFLLSIINYATCFGARQRLFDNDNWRIAGN